MKETKNFVHETAIIDQGAEIGDGTKIWHFCHISPTSKIGKNCSLGQNIYVADRVVIGNNVKIQNNVSVYEGVTIEDDVFCGPSCVFTNVNNPRSSVNRKDEYKKTLIKKGASIGANATIVCGNVVGNYSFIAAGAVVVKDVSDFAIMAGGPAKRIGWMSKAGEILDDDLVCPITKKQYMLGTDNILEEL